MADVNIKIAARTDVGLVRTNNEDNFIVNGNLLDSHWILPKHSDVIKLEGYGSLLVVADGMGGANAGEVASAIAVETIQKKFSKELIASVVQEEDSSIDEHEIKAFMFDAIQKADLNILQEAKENSGTQGMGTTVVVLWILGEKAYVAWCGDSRCYVYNSQFGITRLSKDHSYVQELIDQEKLEPEFAFDHPLNNVITRCLGDSENRAEPEFRSYPYKSGDLFLLCSDGLCGMCRDEEIIKVISENGDDIMKCRDQLISAALEAGGDDNVTVALCQIMMESSPKEVVLEKTLLNKKSGSKKFLIGLGVLFLLVLLYFFVDYLQRPYLNI